MKTSQTILNTLTGSSHFRALQSHRCYRRFLSALPERFQQAIGFVYVRNNILYLALRHPGYKMELTYQKDLFLGLWTQMLKQNKGCGELTADSVILFNSKYRSVSADPESEKTIPYYYELAEGTFENASSNPDLQKQFERLRAIIRRNRRRDDDEHGHG